MKKRVLVDMDGVLADIYLQFMAYEKKESGRTLGWEEMSGEDEVLIFPNGLKHLNEKGFFRTIPVMEGAVEALRYIHEKYDLYIVSAAMEFPNSLEDKYYWLKEHFSFIHWRQVIFCGSKKPMNGDYMIDDHPRNLDTFPGQKIIFSQPHNKEKSSPEYIRIDGWRDIYSIL